MTKATDLDIAVRDIQLDKLDLEQFLKDVEASGNQKTVLKAVHHRLVDESYVKERSVYCALIKEINDNESLSILWEMIGREETKGRRGSLLYAMENMNPVGYLEQLVDLAINDNNEVMFNSLDVIDNLEGYIDGETLERCILKLKTSLKNTMPEWRREALTLLLEEFEE
ncbi:hypothetical protein HH219_21355 [Pseudoalteromonas sp. NEC-BIFX-2020_015]|uniref:hypothetical protein n=1 Tax=Pseudoalteromonas sp. NEC-BIFX-2020_015 TaxID=2729544 RepID=UPI0014613414|nr:hypothetical protein [Pseudoalteromonas sp. NEC-BIFX-2020_015]NMR28037.1 hypothetical protein [Pseudoalteromonas sp. NEC-BIFX-2020_015]